MLNKRGMFLIDAMLALLLVCVISALFVIALSTYLRSSQVEQEDINIEELYQDATRLYDD